LLPYGFVKVYIVTLVTITMKIKKVHLIYNRFYFNEAYNKVLNWFFSYPSFSIGLNDLSVKLKIAKTTASKIVEILVKENFLFKEEIGRVWRITCNKNHIYNYSKKISNNLKNIYESEVLNDISKQFPNARSIILFGSYRKGDDTDKSDIDIAVEVLSNKQPQLIEFGKFENFGFRKNVKINLLVFSRLKIDLNMFSNIANGIVLTGFLEVKPWLGDINNQIKKMQ